MCRVDPVVQSLRMCCQACRVDLVFNLGLPNLPPKSHYLHIVSVAGGVRKGDGHCTLLISAHPASIAHYLLSS